MKEKIYVAAGWFTPAQRDHLDILEHLVKNQDKYDYFFPRQDNLGTHGTADWDAIYKNNIDELDKCDYMVAITTDKDMGTLVEVGQFINMKKPVIFFTPGLKGNFNLMLAKPAQRVCTTIDDLGDALKDLSVKVKFEDAIE